MSLSRKYFGCILFFGDSMFDEIHSCKSSPSKSLRRFEIIIKLVMRNNHFQQTIDFIQNIHVLSSQHHLFPIMMNFNLLYIVIGNIAAIIFWLHFAGCFKLVKFAWFAMFDLEMMEILKCYMEIEAFKSEGQKYFEGDVKVGGFLILDLIKKL